MAVTEVAGIGHGVGFKPVKETDEIVSGVHTQPLTPLPAIPYCSGSCSPPCSRCVLNARVAQHHSAGKPRLLLVPPRAKACVARVMEFGESKGYKPGPDGTPNYLLPGKLDTAESDTSWLESAERHITALAAGETIDPESGLPHLDHLAANAMIVIERREYRKGVYRK